MNEILPVPCPILPRTRSLPEHTTKGELAEQLYPDTTYDMALPQLWVDDCYSKGFDPRSCVVWAYPWSVPLPLTKEARQELENLDQSFWSLG